VQRSQNPLPKRWPGFRIAVLIELPAAQRFLEAGLECAAWLSLGAEPLCQGGMVLGFWPMYRHQAFVVVLVEATVGGPLIGEAQLLQGRQGGFPVSTHGTAHDAGSA